MKFDISAFTHVGTVRDSNQDNILVNGNLLNKGTITLLNQDHCVCFVADGVGGNRAGDYASQFVLERISQIESIHQERIKTESSLRSINQDLLSQSTTREESEGAATTLTGLIADEKCLQIVHCGDSQMWIMRNDIFFKVTNDQILREQEVNSPITSYFGGYANSLVLDTDISLSETLPGDIVLICSDGLFKSLTHKAVKAIVKAETELPTKAQKILDDCLQAGAEDNVSVVLIQRTD